MISFYLFRLDTASKYPPYLSSFHQLVLNNISFQSNQLCWSSWDSELKESKEFIHSPYDTSDKKEHSVILILCHVYYEVINCAVGKVSIVVQGLITLLVIRQIGPLQKQSSLCAYHSSFSGRGLSIT
jgi:hypothetical protein